MVNLLAQVVLAARHKKEPDWMQFLIFGLVAVFWVISGIIKAKSGKAGSEQRREKAVPRKPRQRPTIHPQAVKTLRPERPKRPSRPISQPGRAATEQLKQEMIPGPAKATAEINEELIDSSLGLQDIDLRSRKARPEAARWQFEFDDKKKLKRAIIYREIFGKPLSLRGGDNW